MGQFKVSAQQSEARWLAPIQRLGKYLTSITINAKHTMVLRTTDQAERIESSEDAV